MGTINITNSEILRNHSLADADDVMNLINKIVLFINSAQINNDNISNLDGSKIIDGSIVASSKIFPGTITLSLMDSNSVDTPQIKDGAVGIDQINPTSIFSNPIALNGGKITLIYDSIIFELDGTTNELTIKDDSVRANKLKRDDFSEAIEVKDSGGGVFKVYVKYDDKTIGYNSGNDQLELKEASTDTGNEKGIEEKHLRKDIFDPAGAITGGNDGGAFLEKIKCNVDNTTIGIDTNKLRVKDNSIDENKIKNTAFHANSPVTGGNTTKINLNYDSNNLQVKDPGTGKQTLFLKTLDFNDKTGGGDYTGTTSFEISATPLTL